MRHVDIAVIGSGSGNSMLDERFADSEIVLVEESTFGGTCLNVGCIPTKCYVYAADAAHAVTTAARLGVDATLDGVRWPDVRDRVFGRIDPISAGGLRHRVEDCPHVTVLPGRARFTGPRRLAVETTGGGVEEIEADQVVIAAGSRPTVPDAVASSGVGFHTSDDVMRREKLPERLVVLGGGYIAAEFAHVFSSFGTEVAVVSRGPALLREQDELVSARFTAHAAERWDLHLEAPPQQVRGTEGDVEVTLADGTVVVGDALLVATGRRPNGDRLDLAAGGVEVHDDGRVAVDDQQRTSAAGVWALGDVSSAYQLKHVANHEMAVVADNLCAVRDGTPLRDADHRAVPSAVFTHPQIASVGPTEQQCRAAGRPYEVAVQEYADVAFGWAMEDRSGFCKVLGDPLTGALIGAHVFGEQASTLIQPLIQAVARGRGPGETAREQYWIHPALTEVVENALLALARRTGR